jgi:hypothetical protein
LQLKLLEKVDIDGIRLSAYSNKNKLELLLNNSNLILNKDSRFYFVNIGLRDAIESTFFEELDKIKDKDTSLSVHNLYDKYLKKFAYIENIFEGNKLIIRVT